MLTKSLTTGVVISILSYTIVVLSPPSYGDKRIFAGLLTLVAVGLLGLVWKRESDAKNTRSVIGVGIILFPVTFFLADNTMLGFEKMSGIAISFIIAGIFGLLGFDNKDNNES